MPAPRTLSKLVTDETRIARAWVNFNGTGTVAIRASHNVSSITDNGSSHYSINFTSAFPSANYAAAFAFDVGYTASSGHVHSACLQSVSTTSVRFIMQIPPNAAAATSVECSIITAIFFG